MTTMMLHASIIKFHHPNNSEEVVISARLFGEYIRMMRLLNFDSNLFVNHSND